MGSSGKKKTTMAKRDRENRLRERRADKKAKKEARKQASSDNLDVGGGPAGTAEDGYLSDPNGEPASIPDAAEEAVRALGPDDPESADPREKEVALLRLRDAPDEALAVFEGKLQEDALDAGATEREIRDAQRTHPGHGA